MTASPTRHPVEAAYPLSPLQQGLLYHSVGSAGDDVYVRQVRYDLTGPFDPGTFARAWRVVAAAHPPLRTGVFWEGLPAPLQVVAREPELELAVEDLAGTPAGGRDAAVAAVERRDRALGFELSRPPLVRVTLARLADDDHALVLTFHHIVVDGWSMPMLLGDAFLAYAQLAQGLEPALPPRRPFADYIAWLRRQPPDAAYDHWRRRLRGYTRPVPSLCQERRPADTRHEQRAVELDGRRSAAVGDAARRLRVTPATLLSAAWALALGDALDTDDVLFGTLVSGRPDDLPGVEAMVGLFLNTLPTRTRLVPDARVGDWLRELQATAVEDRRHGHVALSEIARRSELAPGRSPVESLVVYQNAPSILPAELDRFQHLLRVEPVLRTEMDGMPLVLAALPGERLRLVLGVDGAAVEPDLAADLLDRTARAIQALALAPGARLGDLSPGPPPPVVRPPAPAPAVTALLDGPPDDRPAVVDAEGALTYADLRGRAGGIGDRLGHVGAGPERAVVVACRPGADLVAALFGGWRAGAMVVPVDPAAPPEQLDRLLGDCRPVAVVTDTPDRFAGRGVPVVVPGTVAPAPSAGGRAPAAASAAAALYAPVAPGATPRAVVVSHAALAAAAGAWVEAYELHRHPRHLLAGSAGDALLVQAVGAVAAGATMVAGPPGTAEDPERLCDLADRQRVGVVQLTSREAQALAASPGAGRRGLGSVGVLLVGGDPLPPATHRQLLALLPAGGSVLQVSGACEAGIDNLVTRAELDPAGPADRLDRPLANSRPLVLDRRGRPVVPPAVGALLLGGASVARGYLGRPGETAARFVPDPAGPPGSRAFVTGERVRLRAGGVDHSARPTAHRRVRGMRLPLAALEAALSRHRDVAAAAALVDGGRLSALIEPRNGTVDAVAIRRDLASLVAAPLVPDRVVCVASLPRRRDGSLDRSALAAVAPEGGDRPAARPGDGLEWVVATAFAEVLGLERVGVHDSFFAAGGDSLLALMLVGRLRANGLTVELGDVLARPTVAELARHCRPLDEPAGEPAAAGAGAAPLAPSQRRFFANAGRAPEAVDLVEGVELDVELDPGAVQAAVAAVAAAHPALRSRFHREGGGWRQEVADAGDPTATPTLVAADLRRRRADDADRDAAHLVRTLRSTRDLAEGAPWSVLLLVRPGRSQLVVAVHHLVFDPFSWHILLGDLVRAVLLGPDVVTGSASFAAWARHLEALTLASADDQVRFWRGELPAAGQACPVDADGGPNDFGSRAGLDVTFDAGTTSALLRDDQRTGAGAAVEARLAAALARAYATWAGAPGLFLLLQSSGRDLAPPGADLSRTIGWFTCLVPLWLEAGDEPPRETVRRARERLGRALAHKHSWDLLRHGPSAPLVDLPEPAVVLDYLGQPDRADAGAAAQAGVRPLSLDRESRLETAPPDPTMRRTGLIGVEAAVRAGVLHATFHYSRHHHRETTVAALAAGFRDEVLAGLGGPAQTMTKGASGVRPR